MDSPGNDLESIAGQVASGSNMIFFVTGNGSITNFPFVPTIKIVTTTGRFEMLEKDMDVNAGAYLDGTPMEQLGEEMLDLTVNVASGERSVGEKAGHSQVSLWRDWKQTGPTDLTSVLEASEVKSGQPLPIPLEEASSISTDAYTFRAFQTVDGHRSDQLALILPTSLCSGTNCTDDCTPMQRTEYRKRARNIPFCGTCTYRRMRGIKWTFRRDLHPHHDRTPDASISGSWFASGARL